MNIMAIESVTGGNISDVDSGISRSPETVSNGSVARESEETECAVLRSALLENTGIEMYIQTDDKKGLKNAQNILTKESPQPRLPLTLENAILQRYIDCAKEPPPEYDSLCTNKTIKQVLDRRIKRRNANITSEHFIISSDANFQKEFTENYDILIEDKVPSLRIYRILLNSALVWFIDNDLNNVNLSKVSEFLYDSFLQSSSEIESKDGEEERLLQEREVMVLVEIFTQTQMPRPIAQTDIVKKLRAMSFYGSRMQRFLEDTLCDEFALELPLFMAQLFEEIGITLPPELEPYESQENQEEVDTNLPMLAWKASSRGKELLDTSVTVRRSPRKSKPVIPFSPDKSFIKKTPIKTEPTLKRKYIVAETPDNKLIKRQCGEGDKSVLPDETVAQTPFEKYKKLKSKDSKMLTEHLKDSETTIKRRASKRLSFARSTGVASQSSPALSTQTENPVSISNYSQPGPSALSAGSSRNLYRSSSSFSRVSSTKSLASVASFDSSNDHTYVPVPSKPKSIPNGITAAMNAAKVLTPDVLLRYRQRMETVRNSSKRASPTEIFYGRSAGRPNLFAPVAATSQDSTEAPKRATGQMNRSGRKVVQDGASVYVAHTLLNTHNLTPLAPFKPPRDATFKIHKLVRHASRKDWQRLQKFMQKSPRNVPIIDLTDDPEATSSSAP